MKLNMQQDPQYHEPEITIAYAKMDPPLERVVDVIRMNAYQVIGIRDGERVPLDIGEIFYFETVDNKTFAYLAHDVYQCDKRLYELEEELDDTPFIRISKSVIVNMASVASVQPQFSGRMQALLDNGEKVLVSKHYIKTFRAKFLREE